MRTQKDCFVTGRKFRLVYALLHYYHFFLTRFFFWREGTGQLLFRNKLMILRLFARCCIADTDQSMKPLPSGSDEENGRKQPQKGEFNGKMSFAIPSRVKHDHRQALQRILLANWGALGDVVLSSGVIAEIRAKFPECKIGFLVSKKSKVVLETCPPVDWIHEVHSWFVPGAPFWKNFLCYVQFLLTQQRELANQLAQIKYDAAIELRPFIPNIIPLFWKARIPVRIGFSASGNSGLLNHPVEWNCQEYLPYCYPSLLEEIGISLTDRKQILPKISSKNDKPLLVNKPYLLFHLCSSDDRKELPIEFWHSLKLKCQHAGYSVYFTGMGNREKRIIDHVIDDPHFNLCNRLDWDQLVQHIQHAHGIVSVDSVPVHLAAAFDVPCVVIFRRANSSNLWNPDRSTTHAFQFKDSDLVEPIFDVIKQWMPTYTEIT